MSNDGVLSIVMRSSDTVVEIDMHDLPSVQNLLTLLSSEKVKLSKWIILAKRYREIGDVEAFVSILETSKEFASVDYHQYKNDQIMCSDLLALNLISKANLSKFAEERRKFLDSAQGIFLETEGRVDKRHILANAFLYLLKGKEFWDQAEIQFNSVLSQEPKNFLCTMGLGYLDYYKAKYKDALEHFRNALTLCPAHANDARFHIGLSQYHLGKTLEAVAAFERVLSIDPDNCQALVALAIVKSGSLEVSDVRDATTLVTKAFKVDPKNSTAQNYLANHFFFNNDVEKAFQLCTNAYANTEDDLNRSESCYQLGRYYHLKEDYNNAFQNYHQALQLNKSNDLATYGLGQMLLLRSDFEEALDIFKKLSKSYPDDHAVKLFICYISIILHKHKQDLDVLMTYMGEIYNANKADLQMHVAYGELLQFNRPKESLEIWENVLKKFPEGAKLSSFEIHNNIACIAFQLHDFQSAKIHLRKAFTILSDQDINLSPGRLFFNRKLALSRVKYNLGRLYETTHQQRNAMREYMSIICDRGMSKLGDRTIDSHIVACSMIRFAWLCFEQKGDIHNLTGWLSIARFLGQDDATPLSFLGRVLIQRRNLSEAQKHFESIVNKVNTDDSLVQYAKLALGNIWLLTSYNSTDEERKERLLQRALACFEEVLLSDPSNIYAANGIGCVLSYQDRFKEAGEIFALVKEATATPLYHVNMNLAHIHVEHSHYVAGIKYYEECMKNLPKASDAARVLHLIARAYFRARHFDKSLKILAKVRWLEPENASYVYNLGVTLKCYTISLFKNEKSTYEQIKIAVGELEESKRCFQQVASNSTFDKALTHKQIVDCDEVLEKSRVLLERARNKAEVEIFNRKKYQKALNAIRKKNEEEKLQKQLEEEQKRKEQLEKRRAFLCNAERMLADRILSDRNSASHSTEKKSRKKKVSSKEKTRKRSKSSILDDVPLSPLEMDEKSDDGNLEDDRAPT